MDITLSKYFKGEVSDQQVFDYVVTKLLEQGSGSISYDKSPDGNCVYRDGEGRKCAVGHLIPDEEYNKEMDNVLKDTDVDYIFKNFYAESLGFVPDSLSRQLYFLTNLQIAHDHASMFKGDLFKANICSNMKTSGLKHGLDVSVVEMP